MATEKRLIDANAIKFPKYFYEREEHPDPFIEGFRQGKIDAITEIRVLAPTVDAVEVVRCKDCKHWLKDVPGCTDAIGRCRFGNYMVGANGYCVYGERKDNASNN